MDRSYNSTLVPSVHSKLNEDLLSFVVMVGCTLPGPLKVRLHTLRTIDGRQTLCLFRMPISDGDFDLQERKRTFPRKALSRNKCLGI